MTIQTRLALLVLSVSVIWCGLVGFRDGQPRKGLAVSTPSQGVSSGGAQAARKVACAGACYGFYQLAALAAGGPMGAVPLASGSGEPELPAREQRLERGVLCPLDRVANGHLLYPSVGRALATAARPAQAALVGILVYAGVQEPSGPLGGAVDD